MPDFWKDAAAVPEHRARDRAAFERDVVAAGAPVVLRGLTADWPVTHAGAASFAALGSYLLPLATSAPVEAWIGGPDIGRRFGYDAGLAGFNFERRTLGFGALLTLIGGERQRPVYAGAVPVPRVLPRLEAALPMPLLDAAAERLVSLWIGNGSRTIAHWDLPRNLACVVAGRRRFVLMPPEQLPNLYVGPIDFTPAGQPVSLVDWEAPDFARHPKFRDAVGSALVADLAPGDVLYIPSMWWHYVVSEGPGAQVNFWWRDAAAHMMTPTLTLLHALTTLRDLPADERRAWRMHFDHYIFAANGDPAAHLPADRRGVLGPMTPQRFDAVRRRIIKALGG